MKKIKIGIIICDRYCTCAGGKCFRALQNKEGAFEMYKDKDVELAAYTTCGGCPGGNIEYASEEMKKNGVTRVHFATGLLVGYPPCPYYMEHFSKFTPEKYRITHENMKTWNTPFLTEAIKQTMTDEKTRLSYD